MDYFIFVNTFLSPNLIFIQYPFYRFLPTENVLHTYRKVTNQQSIPNKYLVFVMSL